MEGFCEIFYFCFRFHRRIPQSACGCQLPFQGSLDTNEPPLKGEGDQRSWWRGFLPATAASRLHKELRFFFSLLKRKKEAKKEKNSRFTCTTRSNITRRLHERLRTRAIYSHRFSSTKLPRRGEQAAAAAVTLPFLQLKLGRRVSGDPPLSLLKRKKEAKKEKNSRFTCTTWSNITRRLYKRLRTRAIYSHRFSSTKLPRRGIQAAAAAVTLPFSLLRLGRRVSGDSPH